MRLQPAFGDGSAPPAEETVGREDIVDEDEGEAVEQAPGDGVFETDQDGVGGSVQEDDIDVEGGDDGMEVVAENDGQT